MPFHAPALEMPLPGPLHLCGSAGGACLVHPIPCSPTALSIADLPSQPAHSKQEVDEGR